MSDLTDMPSTAADQVELFPVSEAEAAELFLTHFQADVDKAEKALANAAAKLREAQALRDVAEGNLRRVRRNLDTCGDAVPTEDARPATETALCRDDRRLVVPVVANDTGDGTEAENEDTLAVVDVHWPSVVVVLWPGDPEPHVTVIGEETRYLELVADYYVATDGAYGELNEFTVWGEEDGAERHPEDTITPADHGRRLLITKRQEATP